MTAPAAPTVLDARAAAEEIVARFDPGIVFLYGSVFLGTATARSDIDLCVVFDDLGDYSTRHELVAAAARSAAGTAGRAGFVDRTVLEIHHASGVEFELLGHVRPASCLSPGASRP